MFEFLEVVRPIAPELRMTGLVVTKVDARKNYFKQTLETLKELENVHVFDTYIRVDSTVEWSQDNNMPIMAYKKSSRSAKEYGALTEEIEKCARRL
jgi:chromosome partitioning protein